MLVTVHVTPKSSRSELVVQPSGVLRAWVREVPEEGKATTAVRDLLARHFGVAKTQVLLVRGAASRTKTFSIGV